MYSLLLAVIYLAFISLGLPDSLLGSGWPVMHEFFGVSVSAGGIVSTIITAGTVVSSLLSDRMTRKFSTKYVTAASVALTAVSLLAFSFAKSFAVLCLFAVPYGFGAGAIDAALNNYVALHYTSRHMNWLHCFWGVGTIISPYVMSYALTYHNWQTGYRIVSVIQFGITAVLFATLSLWKIHSSAKDEKTDDKKAVGIIGAMKIKGVPFLLFGFMCYCSAEQTCMLWSSTYFLKTRGFSEEKAAALAALFFIGLTAGRFIAGLFSNKVGDRNMVRIGIAVATAGVLTVALPMLPEEMALAGFVIIGLGCAPVYPSIIHSTPYNFGKENSQAIIGIQMAFAYTGSTLFPLIFGFISSVTGFEIMPYYIAFFLMMTIVMVEITYRKTSKNIVTE